jgi:hypothetical protein
MTAPPSADDDPVRLARSCWAELQQERTRRQVSLRALARDLRQEFPREAPAHTTLKDWFGTRKSLPNRPLFLGLVGVLQLDEQHWANRWEHWHQARLIPPSASNPISPARPTANTEQGVSVPPTTATNTAGAPAQAALSSPSGSSSQGPASPTPRRRVGESVTAIVGMVVAGVIVYFLAGWQGPSPSTGRSGAPDLASDLTRTHSPSATPTQLSPATSSAAAANLAAHADFHRESRVFLLYDDRGDGRSAILEMKIDDVLTDPRYNSKGKNTPTKPAKQVPLPTVDPDAVIEFRVCVGEYGKPIPEQTCGAWTTDPG